MSVSNLSEAVAAALARLKAIEQSSVTQGGPPALNSELRKLRKDVRDRINALPWNEERKQLSGLREKLDRALSNWEYQIEVDVSEKRVNQLEKELSTAALNDSKRKKVQKELRQIQALRRKYVEQRRLKVAGEPARPVPKTTTQKIAEYQALKAKALAPCADES